MYKVLFAMQCGKNCLSKKKRRDLDVILVDSRKISIHMSQAEREKYSVPGNFDRDWGRDNLICTHSVSELAFCVAKLTIFYKPFTWIAVGECVLSQILRRPFFNEWWWRYSCLCDGSR